jgi:hypothetical protein
MKLKIRKGFVYNEDDVIIAVLTEGATEDDERTIEFGSEAVIAVEKFVEDVNSGSFKPRGAVKEFEKLIEKYSI